MIWKRGAKRAIKITIPFLPNLTEEQNEEIEKDIDERLQGLNKVVGTTCKLSGYTVDILVVLEEVR